MINFKPIDNRRKVEVSCLEDLVREYRIFSVNLPSMVILSI